MEPKIIFATGNENKMKEIRMILSDLGMPIQSMKEAGIDVDVVEDGSTFEENALIKATEIAKIAGNCIVLADDSGLEIDYLNKEPGIYSARYAGVGHKDITLLAHTFNEWQNGCLVFEGFMDFLAYMTLVKQQDRWFVVESPCDYMILNSVANLKQALHYLDRYTHIHCFLDNDQAGRKTVESISNVFEYRVTDESFRYADYKDVNDYLMRKKRTASE